jgi:hypothetical protein
MSHGEPCQKRPNNTVLPAVTTVQNCSLLQITVKKALAVSGIASDSWSGHDYNEFASERGSRTKVLSNFPE